MFTLRGNKLTFKATAFKAGSNTYRIKIKAVTWVVIPKYPIGIVSPDPVKLTTEKTLTVTVTTNPDDDEALRNLLPLKVNICQLAYASPVIV
jgi:hypothetical protein